MPIARSQFTVSKWMSQWTTDTNINWLLLLIRQGLLSFLHESCAIAERFLPIPFPNLWHIYGCMYGNSALDPYQFIKSEVVVKCKHTHTHNKKPNHSFWGRFFAFHFHIHHKNDNGHCLKAHVKCPVHFPAAIYSCSSPLLRFIVGWSCKSAV